MSRFRSRPGRDAVRDDIGERLLAKAREVESRAEATTTTELLERLRAEGWLVLAPDEQSGLRDVSDA